MKHILRLVIIASIALASLSTIGTASAAEPINTLEKNGLFGYKASGIAIRGYDTVAYFTQGAPAMGLESLSTDWEGATWRFSTQEHLELFEADPVKYAPQYGGYCAYGVAQDGLVKIEPENWSIVDDKLYLNYNNKFQRLWEKDIAGFISEADSKFEALLKSE